MKKATLALFAALLAALTLTGCNTVHGLGQDVQAGGRAIERAADRH
ncbi:MAG: entericidin A/B family lipoprotein [Ottowia sp.]|nr:entericidin A/B family lipoprotein [uncultured Ottowia sp.]